MEFPTGTPFAMQTLDAHQKRDLQYLRLGVARAQEGERRRGEHAAKEQQQISREGGSPAEGGEIAEQEERGGVARVQAVEVQERGIEGEADDGRL
jgi:hypothetical protein